MELFDLTELEKYQGGNGKVAVEDPDFFQFVLRNFAKLAEFLQIIEDQFPDCEFSIADYPNGHVITLDECGYVFTN